MSTRTTTAPPPASMPANPWENEHARAAMRSLDPYPDAKAAFIAAVMAQYKGDL